MKKVELICIGDLKFPGLKDLEVNYQKKLAFFVDFSLRKLKEFKSGDDRTIKEKEGKLIKAQLKKKDFIIALHEQGVKMDSQGFSEYLTRKISYGNKKIVFLIGGHAGLTSFLDPDIDFKLSFSGMTFAHDIFRILFLEQLYRAFTISRGITYHR